MSEEERIDHRDYPGKRREAVFRYITKSLNFNGERPVSADFFFGDWKMAFDKSYAGKEPVPCQLISFSKDGSAPCKALDGSYDNPKDRWEFHDDKTISLWSYIDPIPEYGIDDPTWEENRYHALKMNDQKFVLFNGDASLVMIYEKTEV